MKIIIIISPTQKGAQADENQKGCLARTARANAVLPDKLSAEKLNEQVHAVVWEKRPNIYRHNKRRTDNG